MTDFDRLTKFKSMLSHYDITHFDDDMLSTILNENPNIDINQLSNAVYENVYGRPVGTSSVSNPQPTNSRLTRDNPTTRRGRRFTQAYGLDELQNDALQYAQTQKEARQDLFIPPSAMNVQTSDVGVEGQMPTKPKMDTWAGSVGATLGGLGWGLLDTVSFGLADYMADDEEWDWLQTTAGQIGQGTGTALGFLAPMGAAKGVLNLGVKGVSWGVKSAKTGKMIQSTGRAVKSFEKAGKAEIIKGLSGQGLTTARKTQIAEDIITPMSNQIWSMGGGKPMSSLRNLPVVKKLFGNTTGKAATTSTEQLIRFQKNVDTATKSAIRKRLTDLGGGKLRLSDDALNGINKMYSDILGRQGYMPIHSLEGMFAAAMGNHKWSNRIASGIEEGILFAAAENALTVLPSMEEGADPYEFHLLRPLLMGGTLGTFVKFIKGGSEKKLLKDGWNMWWNKSAKKDIFNKNMNLNNMKNRMKIAGVAGNLFRYPKIEQIFKNIDPKRLKYKFQDGSGTITIQSADDIVRVATDSKEGATQVLNLLNNTKEQALKTWWPSWRSEVAQDFAESKWRMIAGAAVFQVPTLYETGFEGIKQDPALFIYNTLLGAVMSKGGKDLKYKDAQGKIRVADGGIAESRPYTYSKEFRDVDAFLQMTGDTNRHSYFDYLMYDSELGRRFAGGMELNNDMRQIIQILRENNAIVGSTSELKAIAEGKYSKDRKSTETIRDENGNIVELSNERYKEITDGLNQVTIGQKLARLGKEDNVSLANQEGGVNYDIINKVLSNPRFEYLLRESGGGKLLKLNELSPESLKNITNALLDASFDGLSHKKGIRTLDHLVEVLDNATGQNYEKVVSIYKNTVKDVHDFMVNKQYEGSNTQPLARVNKDGQIELITIDVHKDQWSKLTNEQQDLIGQYERMTEFLQRHGDVKLINDPNLNIKFQDTWAKEFAERLNQNFDDLNNFAFGSQINPKTQMPYGETWKTEISESNWLRLGDDFLHSWMSNMAFNKATTKASRLLGDLSNKNDGWKLTGTEKIDNLMHEIFFDKSMLVSNVEVKGSVRLTRFLQNTLNILDASRSTSVPFNVKGANRPGLKDVKVHKAKELETIFNRNGLSGLTNLKAGDIEIFAKATMDKVKLSEMRDLRTSEGKPLNGNQLAQLERLIDFGIVDKNYNVVKFDTVIDNLRSDVNLNGVQVPIQTLVDNAVVVGSGKDAFVSYGGHEIPLSGMFKGPNAKEIASSFSELSKLTGTDVVSLIKDVKTGYDTYIKQFLAAGDGKGFLQNGRVYGDIQLADLMEIKSQLDFIKTNDVKINHQNLMDTVMRLESRSDLTQAQRSTARAIWSNYIDRPRDAAHLIMALQNVQVDGRPLYDVQSREFNWETASAIRKTMEVIEVQKNRFADTISKKDIEQRTKDLGEMFDFIHEVDVQTSLTPVDYVNKYRIKTDMVDPKLQSSDAVGQLLEKYTEVATKDNVTFTEFARYARRKAKVKRLDNESNIAKFIDWDNMTNLERIEFTNDTWRVFQSLRESKKVPKVKMEDTSAFYEGNNYIRKNALTNFLDYIYGDGNYVAVDYKYYDNKKGTRDARDTESNMIYFNDLLSKTETSILKTLQPDINDPLGLVPHINHGPLNLLRFGDLGYGIGVGARNSASFVRKYHMFANSLKSKAAARSYSEMIGYDKTYFDFLYDSKGKVKAEFKEFVEYLNKDIGKNPESKLLVEDVGLGGVMPEGMYDFINGTGQVVPKGSKDAAGTRSYHWNTSKVQPREANNIMNQHMLNMFGMHTLRDVYANKWNTSKDGSQTVDVIKLFENYKLMTNTGANRLSSDQAFQVAKAFKGLLPKKQTDYIKKIGKDGIDMHVIGDELKRGDSPFSVLESWDKEIVKAQKKADKGFDLERPERLDGDINYYGKGDASRFDSVTIISERLYSALKAMQGVSHWRGLGGFKPYIHKIAGVEGIVLGKTFFGRDAKWNTYMKQHGVDMIMTETAVKQMSPDLKSKIINGSDFGSIKDIQNHWGDKGINITENNRMNMKLNDFSLGAIVKAKHDASLPLLGITNDLNGAEMKSFYNWMHQGSVGRMKTSLEGIFGTNNSNEAISWLLRLKDSDGKAPLVDALSKAASYGAPIHAMPAFKNAFANLVKTKLIDGAGMLKPYSTYGGQSVLMPGRDLKSTKFYRDQNQVRQVFDVGEVALPNNMRQKKALNENGGLHIVVSKSNTADKVVSWKSLEKELGLNITRETTLENLYNMLKGKSNKDVTYSIAINGNRTPSTRPSDKLTMALKRFKKQNEGNQIEINQYDLLYRAEGDFDVDKMNFWWDTPDPIMKRWQKTAGDTPAAISGKIEPGANSIKGSLDLLDPFALDKVQVSKETAQRLRGVVGQVKNTLKYLSHYESGKTAGEGFYIDIGSGGRIVFNPEKLRRLWNGENYEGGPLLHSFQEILDSRAGYDVGKFQDNFLRRILFGDHDRAVKAQKQGDPTNMFTGVFELWEGKAEIVKGKKKLKQQWTKSQQSDFITDPLYQEVIMQAINPYKRLLQLSTEVWEGGQGRSVRYQDIINMRREYDFALHSLNKRAYYRLLKDKRFSGMKTDIDAIFKRNNQDHNPYGAFSRNASMDLAKKTAGDYSNLLPFDRIIAEISHKDLMHVGGPKKLHGSKAREFEELALKFELEDISGMGQQALSKTEAFQAYQKMINKDFRYTGYLNYTKQRISSLQSLKNRAYNNGNSGLAESLQNKINDLNMQHDFLSSNITMTEKHHNTVVKYMKNEMLNQARSYPSSFRQKFNKYLDIPSEVKDSDLATWLLKHPVYDNKPHKRSHIDFAVLKRLRDKGPIIEGVNSNQHLDNLIMQKILGEAANISIDMNSDFGIKYGQQFNADLNIFYNKWRKNMTIRNQDRRKLSKKNLIVDNVLITSDQQLMNLMRQEFDMMYTKWTQIGGETNTGDLGRLMLTKLMMPRVNPAKLTYFGKQLGPGFSNSGSHNMFIKFGLNWLNSNEIMPLAERNMMQSHIYGQYRKHYDMYHGNGGGDAAIFGANIDFYNKYSGATSGAGLVENFGKLTDIEAFDLMAPGLKQSLGLYENRTINYLMTTGTTSLDFVTQMKAESYHKYLPFGKIEQRYAGGAHPKLGYAQAMKGAFETTRALLGGNMHASPYKIQGVPEMPFDPNVSIPTRTKRMDRNQYKEHVKNRYDINCPEGGS